MNDEFIDTSQYSMKSTDGGVLIHDKVNDQLTKATNTDSGITLEDVSKTPKVDDEVTWVGTAGDKCIGILKGINGDLADVEVSGTIIQVKLELLNKMDNQNKQFSKSRARKFVIDDKNNLIATGWESSLGRILKDNQDYRMISSYDIDGYQFEITKKFSNLSEENQKLFTKPYRRYVVLDEEGKYKYLVDISNAKGLIAKNPGWSLIRESVYRRGLQEKLANFSEDTVNALMNEFEGSMSTAKYKSFKI